MARIPVRAMRRQELIEAAYNSIKESGFRGFALEQVARYAGTVKGTIHHYFRDKEELVDEVVRYANRDFSQTILEMIKAAKSPSERLWSIISLNLSNEYFRPTIARSYAASTAMAIRYPHLQRTYDATDARTISNIAFALRSIAKGEDVESIANAIWTMIEGAWLLQATRKENIAGATLAQLADYLSRAVPGFDSSVVQNLDHFLEGPTPSNNRI
jgi:TetR/AcrR family transcriptional repressor of bet genes